ncbi:GntR family transcriptional regulator [Rhodococcus sp. SC4]|uniref:GntR family transcriptional regulator n=1 Tax=Rhodococcus sp. LB1 TaxID=1807499 RepID=UPI00076AC902|nr:GntR family transcriptional regulator [Rhodococcus sp. LB1]KXF52573.1 GntR family transcriptional regulator [Rhodococcus sp. SC4]KXX63025.1 GntR family transcriptional regulator [Rhodococcus sp. LB1]
MTSAGAAKRGSNRERVYAELRRRIVTLELAPGASLSENELAAQLSVSRTPVRESLILLAEEGLVHIFPKLGSFVARIDPERVADAQFVREAIELASIADAEQLVDEPAIAELRELIAAQNATTDVNTFFELDEQFHKSLLAVGGHGSAWRTVVGAKAHLDRARRLGIMGESSLQSLACEHAAVVDALEARDGERAAAALRTHLRKVFTDIEKIRDRSPELFSDGTVTRPTRRVVAVWS